ncbi:hypothetical protein LS71_002725 [Helicobacter jaachi]|uniref:Uncharacterized protein n=1 Tax=Helicobacter jaachi TaxID=1677920 RepID=A0A4V6I2W0_9HELI|nr:hypothetical protein [Helicobacter jaachi]TLD97672.1 hypothetical protein LS71_002725 [Helicobacter jaachi]
MREIYTLKKSEILSVQGEYTYIGEDLEHIYIEGENLKKPFVKAVLPKDLLDKQAQQLKAAQSAQIAALERVFSDKMAYFYSEVLGVKHFYDNELSDQINLNDAQLSGVSVEIRCRAENEEQKSQKLHTKEQIKQLNLERIAQKDALLEQFRTLKDYILSLEDIKAVGEVDFAHYEGIKAKNTQKGA